LKPAFKQQNTGAAAPVMNNYIPKKLSTLPKQGIVEKSKGIDDSETRNSLYKSVFFLKAASPSFCCVYTGARAMKPLKERIKSITQKERNRQ
jgi:hypothetical protein